MNYLGDVMFAIYNQKLVVVFAIGLDFSTVRSKITESYSPPFPW